MSAKATASLDRAGEFVRRNARLVERALFNHLFVTPSPRSVVAALGAYQNEDGGFGNALEADIRAPASMPVACEQALIMLWQAGIRDRRLASALCAYLASVARADGYVPIVTREILDYPRAAHWSAPSFDGDSPNPTAGLVGMLLYQGAQSEWLSSAAEWCWRRLERPLQDAHETACALRFLECAPDRDRAREVALRLARAAEHTSWFLKYPDPSRYAVTPLILCPTPDAIGRAAISDEIIDAHLDALVAQQQDDGGWPISWEAPGVGAAIEWRGRFTLDALITLHAYDRLRDAMASSRA
jgi:hypothetical protein